MIQLILDHLVNPFHCRLIRQNSFFNALSAKIGTVSRLEKISISEVERLHLFALVALIWIEIAWLKPILLIACHHNLQCLGTEEHDSAFTYRPNTHGPYTMIRGRRNPQKDSSQAASTA